MALKGPGKPNPASLKSAKSSPYGKLPEKAKKKPKKDGTKDAGNNQSEGVGLKEVFSILGDENGRITSAKLRSFVKDLDLEFTEDEIKDMIDVVDPSGKGDITYSNMIGIVRDFSHEFPTVQLTPEELTRELTNESVNTSECTTEGSVKEAETGKESDGQNAVDDNAKPNEERKTEEEVSRPMSSKARAAAVNARRIMRELEDKMSVITEGDEAEDDNGEDEVFEKDEEKENKNEDENDNENVQNGKELDSEVGNDVDKSERSEQNSDDDKTESVDNNTNGDNDNGNSNDNVSVVNEEIEAEPGQSKPPSRASTIKTHRLDSGVSTAIGRMSEKEMETSKSQRKNSKTENNVKQRRDSQKLDKSQAQKPKSRERSNSRSKVKPDQKVPRKTSLRRKSVSADDPEFYSTMGCSLKLSQIRTRQRILYVMWRAVYDQALRKMYREEAKENTKRKRLKNVKPSRSLDAF